MSRRTVEITADLMLRAYRHGLFPMAETRADPRIFLVESDYRVAMQRAEREFVHDLLRRIGDGWGPLDLWRGFHEDREATLAAVAKLVEAAFAKQGGR